MPHDVKGNQINVGDIVRGKGYNVKDSEGNLKEITGIAVHVNPGSAFCNLQILHNIHPLDGDQAKEAVEKQLLHSTFLLFGRLYRGELERGQCDHFTRLD